VIHDLRFVNELESTPIPNQIKGKQRASYKRQFKKSIYPYKVKQKVFKNAAQDFWSDKKSLSNYSKFIKDSEKVTKNLLRREVQMLASTAPKSKQASTLRESLSSDKKNSISVATVNSAWKKVKENPFNMNALDNLKDIERRRGSETVLSYIDIRKKTLKGGS